MPLTDWGKVQTALTDLLEAAARIFPVKKLDNNLPTYSPVNPKDVYAIAKAIAEKGINSAMVSTLIDGLFGNDDMLPFDIKQTCRMIFDGAGMIVFKQEWEDNLEKMLAKASGDQHPLRNSSLQRLMGRDPQMVSPQVQAQGLRASEVAATTRAVREAIRTACRVVAKPSPWTTIKQAENDGKLSFAEFRAYFADRVLSGEELHELFHTIGTHNTDNLDTEELCDYFSKHLGVYENVLSVLEDLNITILKATEKTKKVSKNCDIFFTLYILFVWSISADFHGKEWQTTQEKRGRTPEIFIFSYSLKSDSLLWRDFLPSFAAFMKGWIEEDSQWMIQINRLQKLIDRLEKKDLNLEPLKEEVLEENARSHIMIVQHQMSVIEEKVEEFHLALKQYLETASAQGGCLQ
ncbi:hypothetical protein HGM15179_016973 [Zosterops borbonicus]|uniref:EF-hand domain-containing protein n=1 Tax=Zosterops borbonicus TaxID=364589 RepID=A0A8K1G1X2_9PASS|nr:hypothetical protein HGM15179_016973 [Zosterops borbonicus]